MNALEQFRVLNPTWHDAVEILIVAYVMYRVLLLFHGTRAVQMAVGIVLLFAAYAVAWVLKLGMITYLLGLVFTYGAFALLVVFPLAMPLAQCVQRSFLKQSPSMDDAHAIT